MVVVWGNILSYTINQDTNGTALSQADVVTSTNTVGKVRGTSYANIGLWQGSTLENLREDTSFHKAIHQQWDQEQIPAHL